MNKHERFLIRSCLCNGFEFHSRLKDKVVIGKEEITMSRFEELLEEVEKALDMLEGEKE